MRAQPWAHLAGIALMLDLTQTSVGAKNVFTLEKWCILLTMLERLTYAHTSKGLLHVTFREGMLLELPA